MLWPEEFAEDAIDDDDAALGLDVHRSTNTLGKPALLHHNKEERYAYRNRESPT